MDELEVGSAGDIVAVDAPGPVGTRLRDLGFLPGTRVEVERRAPLGDPTVYVLRGTRLCLRSAEAHGIEVRRLG